MPASNVLSDVRRWVRRHPEGDLWVCTGFLSAWGLARLAEMTPDRPVMLLTTKPWRSVSDKATAPDRRAALAFLNRPDVRVHMWWRQARNGRPARDQHVKAFIVDPLGQTPAALTGSANLTRAGMTGNQEAMLEVSADGVRQLLGKVHRMLADGHPCQKQRVIDRLTGTRTPQRREPPKPTNSSQRAPVRPTQGRVTSHQRKPPTVGGVPAATTNTHPTTTRHEPVRKRETEINQVRQQVSARDLAQMIAEHNGGQCVPTGNGWQVTCPNPHHPDRNPSCSVANLTGRAHYYCFSCKAKGDVYAWVMLARLADRFAGAHEYLTRRLDLGHRPPSAVPEPPVKQPPDHRQPRIGPPRAVPTSSATATVTRERPSAAAQQTQSVGLFRALVNTVRQHRQR